MHPVLALRDLEGLEKEIVRILSGAGGGLTQNDILRQLGGKTTQSSLSRAMTRLIRKNILSKTGATRNASFALAPEAIQFARPWHLRPPVPYDPNRIGSYQPNQTRWLPEEAERRMRDATAHLEHHLDASTYSRQIAERFLIDLSWASSALEGNTYDYLQTEALIKYGSEAQGHDLQEATMILNHKRAITLMLEDIGNANLDPTKVCRLHALLMQTFISPADLGRLRASDVAITGTAYRPTGDRYQIASDFSSILWKAEQVQNPFEASFALLVGLPYLQPFVDGNKRVGRLVSNLPLLRSGLPPLSFIGVDKGDYLAGLIYFYETGDTSLLAHVVSRGYAEMAPSYKVAVATHRQPRSIELREREAMAELVRRYVHDALAAGTTDHDIEAYVEKAFAHLDQPDREVIRESVQDALASLNDVNSVVWGVPSEEASRFAEIRNAASGHRLG